MTTGRTLSKWQRRSVQSLAITAIIVVPIMVCLIATAATELIFDHPWYIAAAGIAIFAVVFVASEIWDALIFAELTVPLPTKNTGMLGGFTDKVTDTALSLLHRRDRKRSAQ